MVINSSITNKSGMSLVGLLIGMALSAIILAGMLQVFSSMRRSSQLIKNETELNETLLFVVQNMSKVIAQAGHVRPSATHQYPLIYNLATGNHMSAESWYVMNRDIFPSYWCNGYVNPNTDANGLWLNFQGDTAADIRHCDGTLVANNTTQWTVYSVKDSCPPTPPYELTCGNNYFGKPFAKGIMKMYVRFGNDSNMDGAVDQYLGSTSYLSRSPFGLWNPTTKTVRVGIIMRTADPVFPSDKLQTFTLFKDIASITYNDKYLYKSVVFTVPLLDAPQDY